MPKLHYPSACPAIALSSWAGPASQLLNCCCLLGNANGNGPIQWAPVLCGLLCPVWLAVWRLWPIRPCSGGLRCPRRGPVGSPAAFRLSVLPVRLDSWCARRDSGSAPICQPAANAKGHFCSERRALLLALGGSFFAPAAVGTLTVRVLLRC